MSQTTIDRRGFLKSGAGIGGGLIIGFMLPPFSGRLKGLVPPVPAEPESGDTFAPNAFLRIGTDNSIRVILSHVEMGQGVWTTLTLLLAEELDADISRIGIEHAPPGKAYIHTAWGSQLTGGSSSTWSEFDRYRRAGAAARILLTEAAARKWKVPAVACRTENGYVLHGDKKLSYGELAASAAALPLPAEIPLRKKSQWKYIGKGMRRLDGPEKVNGKAVFGMDVQVEDMQIAVVAHCPVMGGTVRSYDAGETLQVKGVLQVVQIPTGVAVIAGNTWAAIEGRKKLKVEWDFGKNVEVHSATQYAEFARMAEKEGKTVVRKGNPVQALQQAAQTLTAEYTMPYLAHASMEPLNCTVRLSPGKCEIWTGTQMPGGDQAAAARILGLKPEQVQLTTPFLGGAFGRRATPGSDFVSEAVHIAKASGKVIKMIWTREDDTRGGYYRPAFLHRVKAGIDSKGMPRGWQHVIVGQALPGDNGNGNAEGISDSPYLSAIPDHHISQHAPPLGITTLWLRSVGHTHTAFVMECMIDELAYLAGKDPVEYRRQLLKNHPRNLGVLNLAAEKAGWGKPLPPGHFQGIAVHESFRSYCAQVAEISIGDDGLVKVHRVTAAIDCGLAVNPDGVRAQIESGINYALSHALYGAITFNRGQVEQSNFHNYRILRLNESPLVIDTHIVDSDQTMGGVGEPGYPPLAPAVANAIFAATGKRIRQMPFGTLPLKG